MQIALENGGINGLMVKTNPIFNILRAHALRKLQTALSTE